MEETKIHPEVIKVMTEIGIDIFMQTSKTIGKYIDRDFDDVITACVSASDVYPFFQMQSTDDTEFPRIFQKQKELMVKG